MNGVHLSNGVVINVSREKKKKMSNSKKKTCPYKGEKTEASNTQTRSKRQYPLHSFSLPGSFLVRKSGKSRYRLIKQRDIVLAQRWHAIRIPVHPPLQRSATVRRHRRRTRHVARAPHLEN